MLTLPARQLVFRTRTRIYDLVFRAPIRPSLQIPAISVPPLQRRMVGDPESAPQIFARFAAAQMLKQRKEGLLDHFLAVRLGDIEARYIAKKRTSELVKKSHYLVFQQILTGTGVSRICLSLPSG